MKIYCVGGQPQSGSTFIFNALRHLALSAYDPKSIFSGELSLRSVGIISNMQPEISIIKTHSRAKLSILVQALEEFGVETTVITSRRDLLSCAASYLKRRGREHPDLKSVAEEPWLLYHYLSANMLYYDEFYTISDLEIPFKDVVNNPSGVVKVLLELLVGNVCDKLIAQTLEKVRDISSSAKSGLASSDNESLLSPFHQTSLSKREFFFAWKDLFDSNTINISSWALRPFNERYGFKFEIANDISPNWKDVPPWVLIARAVSCYCAGSIDDCFSLVALVEKHKDFLHGSQEEEMSWMLQSKYYGFNLRDRLSDLDLAFYSSCIEAVGAPRFDLSR